MLPQLDLSLAVLPASMITAILSASLAIKLHRLFGTGLSLWASIAAVSMVIYVISLCIATDYGAASAVADIGIVIAGFAAYAASRWLKGQFELVADHGN